MGDRLRLAIEGYLGAETAPDAFRSRWELVTILDGLPPFGRIAILLTLLFGLVAICAFAARMVNGTSRRRRTAIIGLHAIAGLILSGCLLRLALRVQRIDPPILIVLIDESSSMGLREATSESASTEGESSSEGTESPPTRLQQSIGRLLADDASLLASWGENHRLVFVTFSDEGRQIAELSPGEADRLGEIGERLGSVTPEGSSSRPAAVLRTVLDRYGAEEVTGVVAITDGVATDPTAELATFRRDDVPIFFLVPPGSSGVRNLELVSVTTDAIAYLDRTTTVRVTYRSTGFGKGRSRIEQARLVLREHGTDRLLDDQMVSLGPDGQLQSATLAFRPNRPRTWNLAVEIEPVSGEVSRGDNSAVRSLPVRRESARVLLVDSVPRYEYRFLASFLDREPTVSLDTILTEIGLLGQPTLYESGPDRSPGVRWPDSIEDLRIYDVIILGDVSPAYFDGSDFGRLTAFVEDHGRALIFIAGDQFNPIAYGSTPLADLLPFQIDSGQTNSPVPQPFRPVRTPLSQRTTRLLTFADADRQDEQIWAELPPLRWLFPITGLKPSASVLLKHPDGTPSEPLPVLIRYPAGRGSVVVQATDDFHVWRDGVGDRFFGRYWLQLIGSLLGDQSRREASDELLIADHPVYREGDPVTLTLTRAKGVGTVTATAPPEVVLEADSGLSEVFPLEPTTSVADSSEPTEQSESTSAGDLSRVWTKSLSDLPPGSYRATLRSPSSSGQQTAAVFTVDAFAEEYRSPNRNTAGMRQVAEQTGGAIVSFPRADSLAEQLPSPRGTGHRPSLILPLWNRAEVLLLFATVMGGIWVFRRSRG